MPAIRESGMALTASRDDGGQGAADQAAEPGDSGATEAVEGEAVGVLGKVVELRPDESADHRRENEPRCRLRVTPVTPELTR